MGKAIGMVEYLTVSTGVQAADMILKTAKVSIIEAKTVCPGKYIIIFSGELSAVNASIEASKNVHGEKLIEVRIARGMSGKSYLMLTGDIGAVEAAIKKASAVVGKNGMLLDSSIMANPDEGLWNTIL